MTNKEYDLMIKELLEKYLDAQFSFLPPENEAHYEFSDNFNKKMEKLIKQVKHPYLIYINTTAKKVAVAVACIVLILTSLLSVTAVREKIVDFFYEIFDTHTSVEVEFQDSKTQIDKYYTLSYLPNDYKLAYEYRDDIISDTVWMITDNKTISLFQEISFRNKVTLNSEDVNVEERTVNNTPCLFMNQENNCIYFWEFDGYNFTLTYDVSLGEDFAAEVIGKLVECDG